MTLLFDILSGMLLGMCYDIFKAFRRKTKAPAVGILLDLLFWGIALVLCVWLFLLTGDRKFRFYELFGMMSGFGVYFLTAGVYFVKISEKIADFFLFFFKFLFTIFKFFAIMIKNGVLFLCKPFGWLLRIGKKGLSNGAKKWKRNWKLMKRI